MTSQHFAAASLTTQRTGTQEYMTSRRYAATAGSQRTRSVELVGSVGRFRLLNLAGVRVLVGIRPWLVNAVSNISHSFCIILSYNIQRIQRIAAQRSFIKQKQLMSCDVNEKIMIDFSYTYNVHFTENVEISLK